MVGTSGWILRSAGKPKRREIANESGTNSRPPPGRVAFKDMMKMLMARTIIRTIAKREMFIASSDRDKLSSMPVTSWPTVRVT